MIVIPHRGGVGRVEKHPRVHSHHVSITEDLIIGFPMSGRVEGKELPVQGTAQHTWNTTQVMVCARIQESGFAYRQHVAGHLHHRLRSRCSCVGKDSWSQAEVAWRKVNA